jgi:hypothetical protein
VLIGVGVVRVTEDEADAMAAGCDEAKCWAGPGQFCKTPSGTRRRPHPPRVDKARQLGLLGGGGRVWLQAQPATEQSAGMFTVGGTTLILPPARQAGSGAC